MNRYMPCLLIACGVVGACIRGQCQWTYVDAIYFSEDDPRFAASTNEGSKVMVTLNQDVAGLQEDSHSVATDDALLLPSGMLDGESRAHRAELRKRMLDAASAGDTPMQKRVAVDLLDDRNGFFDKDYPEAYKWASIAFSEGDEDARYLLAEFDLFMPSDEREKGAALAKEHLAAQSQARDAQGGSAEAQHAAPKSGPPIR